MDRFIEAQILVATVEAGSITGAADTLSLDKSVVSRRIKALEARLGTKLLNRSTRTLSLTDAGRSYYGRAQSLIRDWRDMEDEVSGADCALAGPIRIAAPLSFGLTQLGPALIDFQRDHPDIRLDVDFSDRKIDLIADGFDIAIRIGRLDDSALVARKLGDVRMVCAASPDWLKNHASIETPDDLRGAAELRYGLRQGKSWSFLAPDGSRHSVSLDPVMRASNGDFLRDAAKAGLGLVIEPDFILCDDVRAGHLVQLLPGYVFDAPSVYAVWPPQRHLARRVRVLVDSLVARFEGRPPWSLEGLKRSN
ncbi:LysR family transcriptional regulator [Algimonas porphyrae]|uniref:LysR family transcriptional regulator n=1 Tax=Algimonas porphyrae TaxID=1128113 RepID=A0ABQ5UYG6_9PROT|nr:LysR family transcriptional regulator [Algimonas porphyrae]GLQ19613.1 LysR family transcriptional regulator [Algimonas porphyrae]